MSSLLLHGKTIVFIGAGNMAEALVKGLVESGLCRAEQIRVTDVSPGRLAYFRENYGVSGTSRNDEHIADADVLVLAVKPQVMAGVLAELRARLNPAALAISIAAGIPTARIEGLLGGERRVVRVMPNTPALVRRGVSALCGGRYATAADLELALGFMRAVGEVVQVTEVELDAVTALSGSGPAYCFYLLEAMLAAAAAWGMDPAVARKLVFQTMAGAAELVLATEEHPAELRRRVTSPGGTTAAAIEVLERAGVGDAWRAAFEAARRRAGELSRA